MSVTKESAKIEAFFARGGRGNPRKISWWSDDIGVKIKKEPSNPTYFIVGRPKTVRRSGVILRRVI